MDPEIRRESLYSLFLRLQSQNENNVLCLNIIDPKNQINSDIHHFHKNDLPNNFTLLRNEGEIYFFERENFPGEWLIFGEKIKNLFSVKLSQSTISLTTVSLSWDSFTETPPRTVTKNVTITEETSDKDNRFKISRINTLTVKINLPKVLTRKL